MPKILSPHFVNILSPHFVNILLFKVVIRATSKATMQQKKELIIQMFKKYSFQKRTPPSSEMQNLFQRWHLKDIEEKNHGFEKSGALQITILQKVSGYIAF